MNLKDLKTDRSWTLFLDRDGVINRKIENSYVLEWDDFKFLDGVKEAFRIFKKHFGRIIVVTNQQCVGKGLIDAGQIEHIHSKMIDDVFKSGGKIDSVYFSPDVESILSHNLPYETVSRKPGTFMAIRAKKEFPEIDFNKSVMAGDSYSDMLFGRRLGMKNILIGENKLVDPGINALVSFKYNNLKEFADSL